MASRKKKTEEPVIIEEEIITKPIVETAEEEKVPAPAVEVQPKEVKEVKKVKETKRKAKYPVGSIVYVAKEADADLNGFKLFPQYKKYTYTVEAYDEKSGVYTLRKLNLSLLLKEELILAPEERADDHINRLQF